MARKANTPKKHTKLFDNTAFADEMSRAYNAQLVMLLSLAMQKKIADYVVPQDDPVASDRHERAER